MLESLEKLKKLMTEGEYSLSAQDADQVLRFYQLMLEENAVQNLTRLISPEDFYYGHVVDVLEFHKVSENCFPALDLGSGGGVPGLLSAVIRPDRWILSDSEGRKAEYLRRAVNTLGLDKHVDVFSGRAEAYLRANQQGIQSIVARAVGTVEKIFSWVEKCSTWNNLILFKGPGWDEEWKSFQESRWAKKLKVIHEYSYVVGPEKKQRRIIVLTRVPRGTLDILESGL
jgi:16S rRNA (guanine(527)-N(7))-methyltransferase RsmG